MVTVSEGEAIRQSSLRHQWMHSRDWTKMAEEDDPLVMVEGKGVRVTDSSGKSWIDVNGGYVSVNVGYGRQEIVDAAYEQMTKVNYFPMGTTTVPVIQLAEKLAQLTPGSLSRVFQVSGGSEANESALKITRAYYRRVGEPDRFKIVSRKASYHGTTGGVLWLGDSDGVRGRTDFEPAILGMLYAPQPNPYHCEFGGRTPSECAVLCAEATEKLIQFHDPRNVAAIIGEPVASPRAVSVPGDEYWPMIREICDKYGILLIADEVVTGFGRTGKMFAIDHWGVVPDIMSVAKGIVSSYLPVAATIVKKEVADYFGGPGNQMFHALTYGGHPVAAAAALKNIEIIENEGLVKNSAEVGAYFKGSLEGLMEKHPIIGDVRGLGLLIGVELVSNRATRAAFSTDERIAERLSKKFRNRGLILFAGDHGLTLGPPLCITRSEIDEIVTALDESIGELEGELDMKR